MADDRSFQEMLEYRIALLKLESAFEACSRFGEKNKQSFYEEVRNRLAQHNSSDHANAFATAERSSRFNDRCLALADMAPTAEIQRFLLSIVEFCDANPDIDDTVAGLRKRSA